MNLNQMIETLNQDLKNEWMHLRFYLYHASAVTGLHREELKEMLLEEAASEMKHVLEFSDLIRGLGGVPTDESNEFDKFNDPTSIFTYALKMEENVVAAYVDRLEDAENLYENDKINGKWIQIFLENQIEASREDVDHFKQMIK